MAVVLIADDDASIRAMLEAALPSHRCLFAKDGVEALDVLGREEVDAVVLDVMMPRLDGIETLRRIRGDSQLHDLPVIMLTAKVSEEDHLRGFQQGADAYITKPFSVEALEQVLATVLRRAPAERARIRDDERAKAALLRYIERRFPG